MSTRGCRLSILFTLKFTWQEFSDGRTMSRTRGQLPSVSPARPLAGRSRYQCRYAGQRRSSSRQSPSKPGLGGEAALGAGAGPTALKTAAGGAIEGRLGPKVDSRNTAVGDAARPRGTDGCSGPGNRLGPDGTSECALCRNAAKASLRLGLGARLPSSPLLHTARVAASMSTGAVRGGGGGPATKDAAAGGASIA